MGELKDLVKSYPELGEVLAEMRIDISVLQNSDNGAYDHRLEGRIIELEKTIETLKIPRWDRDQWGSVDQLKAVFLHLQKKLTAHIDAGIKASKKKKYTIKTE